MKTIQLLAALFLIACTACNPSEIYKEYNKDFSRLQWEKSKKIEFTPEITDTTSAYKIVLAFRHVHGFQYREMSVKVNLTSPTGKSSEKSYTFPVMKNDNEYLSECAGDICDLESVIEESMHFNEIGKYNFSIQHNMPADVLPNVMEFGMVIEKVVEAK